MLEVIYVWFYRCPRGYIGHHPSTSTHRRTIRRILWLNISTFLDSQYMNYQNAKLKKKKSHPMSLTLWGFPFWTHVVLFCIGVPSLVSMVLSSQESNIKWAILYFEKLLKCLKSAHMLYKHIPVNKTETFLHLMQNQKVRVPCSCTLSHSRAEK